MDAEWIKVLTGVVALAAYMRYSINQVRGDIRDLAAQQRADYERLAGMITALSNKLAEMDTKVTVLSEKLTALSDRVTALSDKVTALSDKLAQTNLTVTALPTR